jgi:hypothetical protein
MLAHSFSNRHAARSPACRAHDTTAETECTIAGGRTIVVTLRAHPDGRSRSFDALILLPPFRVLGPSGRRLLLRAEPAHHVGNFPS